MPLLIGIILAVTLGSWIFLAFSALGLVTGGVPATSELFNRRRTRLRIRKRSALLLAEVDAAVPPAGLLAFRNTRPPADAHPAKTPGASSVHPLRFGSGCVRPPLKLEPATYRGPQIVPIPGAVIANVSPGGLGLITGSGAMFGAVIRSAVLQLAFSCERSSAHLLIVGATELLPPEARYLPGVHACHDVDAVDSFLDLLPPGSVVMAMPGLERHGQLVSRVRAAAHRGQIPGVVLAGVSRQETSDWVLDVTTASLHIDDLVVRLGLDGISQATLANVGIAAEPEISTTVFPSTGVDGVTGRLASPGSRTTERVWRDSSELDLRCRIGQGIEGDLDLDFVGDGPHVLVAGTTGAGKSELLKSITMDLICRYGPDQLALVLLDFKGGSTLSPYAETPHCQSLVTDLNVESGERVLAGLRVELRRRESLFKDAHAEDYQRYRRSAPSGAPPLPRLLVIVDEFRILTDELPDAVPELMRIATVGRSLGVHLLLATQRPQGVVTASMRANINTIISLRLLNTGDSQELLGSAVAAEIPTSSPGSGYVRTAGEPPRPFRSMPVDGQNRTWTVQELGPRWQDCRTVATVHGPTPAESTPALELAALTANRVMPALPVSSFAPPLPVELHFIPGRLRRQRPNGAIALGLLDDIEHQRLAPLWWDPERQRRLAVIAGPGSAAPSALLRVVATLARESPERHIYVLDGTGHFSCVAGIPRVAGYVGIDEPERVSDLLDSFEGPADSTVDASPTRILLISGLAGWATALGASNFASLDDRVAVLARTASQRNASLIVIGDRDLVSSRYLALAEHRLYVRFGLGPETTMGWPKLRQTAPLPGRAVWVGPDTAAQGGIVQLCTPPPSSTNVGGPRPELPIRRCLPLPHHVPAAPVEHNRARPGVYHVGVMGPENRPWTWEPGAIGLVLGGPRSGKTSLIRLLAHQLDGQFSIAQDVDPDDVAPDVLLLDDALELSDARLATLDAMIRSGTHVIMTSVPDRARLQRLPSSARMLPSNAYLLLNPRQASDGDLPGWRLQPHRQSLPGRAIAMVGGSLKQAQCAHWEDGQEG
ncbi:FtsK/SpoIIIE domain-containing protein [Arthrobacter sp.]|uniref:FtsK/SpoIIIE domain-containing protein n=1 Tax=Arthrobacter sp. TaxID=1667 RepID=UPI003A94A721